MSAAPTPAAGPSLPEPRRLGLRLASAAGVLVLLVAAVSTLPALDEVRRRFADASLGWVAASLLLQVGSCLAFVAVYRGVFCRRLRWKSAYHLGMAVQGTNVLLPAGGASGLALGAWALHRLGMPAQRLAARTVAFFLLTSAVNFGGAVLAGWALAFALVPGDVPVAFAVAPALAATLAIAFVAALPRLAAPRTGAAPSAMRLLHAARAALHDGITEAGALLRAGQPLVVLGAIGYMTFDLLALGAAFAAVGTVPALAVLLLAYVVGQLGGLIPLPGGVGGADGGLIAALALYGIPLAEAAAAVLAYRAFQLCLPALLGTLSVIRLPRVLATTEVAVCGSDARTVPRPPAPLGVLGPATVRLP